MKSSLVQAGILAASGAVNLQPRKVDVGRKSRQCNACGRVSMATYGGKCGAVVNGKACRGKCK